MLNSLMVEGKSVTQLIQFSIDGVHSELYGAGNNPWDTKVADVIRQRCAEIVLPENGQFLWFAVKLKWFAKLGGRQPDLDNFRLKPVLDKLTDNKFWADDNISIVRAIYNEVEPVGEKGSEKLDVVVFGIS